MRLIDADVYCATICRCNRRECDKAKCPIHNAPTAYDIDKVVEELEELKMRYFLTIANTGDEKSDFAYENVGNALDKAIEIVKQGGVGTETETIRDKAVKWNNNSSKRVPYEFIDYVEGKREIGVSDDVCE